MLWPTVMIYPVMHNSRRTIVLATRQYSQNIAILGGGVSGLTAAYFIQKSLPDAKITVIEANRLGGWVSSKRVLDSQGKHIIFEEGPRSLRPGGLPGLNVLDLIRQLNLQNEMILVPKSSASAKNRFIYYAGVVHKLPSSIYGFLKFSLQNPILKGSLPSIIREPFRRRPIGLLDESIGSFMSRRFSPLLANNVISAVVHGIYSGSIDQLSIKSTFKGLWKYETRAGSVIAGLLRGTETMSARDQALQRELISSNYDMIQSTKDISVYSFQGGLSTLTNAVIKYLSSCSNVTFQRENVVAIEKSQNYDVQLSDGSSLAVDMVVSAVKARTLSQLLTAPPVELSQITYSTVMVVNFFYASPDILPISGFGYLIPRSVPLEENPDRALGVVFDSSSVPGQDGTPGTKVTCIMGGHFWSHLTEAELPSEHAGYVATKKVMSMHLGVTVEPEFWSAKLQPDCIPQYTVGHHARMVSLNHDLEHNWPGLSVIGSSFAGVSVNDCILNARKLASNLKVHGKSTGLEDFES